MKFECPVCGSKLHHERIDDGFILNKIESDGEVTELANSSNGSDRVFCSKSEDHTISDEMIEAVLDILH